MKQINVKTCTLSVLTLVLLTAIPQVFAQTFDNSKDSTSVPGENNNTQDAMRGAIGSQPGDESLGFQRNSTCTLKGGTVDCPKYTVKEDTTSSAIGAWKQTYETMTVNNCGDGLQGSSVFMRKVYTPPATSMEAIVYEPWYLSQNGCAKKLTDHLTPGQVNDVNNLTNTAASSFVNTIYNSGLNGNQQAQAAAMIADKFKGGTIGNFASPTFNNIYVDENGTPVGAGGNRRYSGMSVCTWGPYQNFEIQLGTVSSVGGLGTTYPYPQWQPTSMGNGGYQPKGPICPPGSGLQNFGDRGYETDAPAGP